MFTNNVEGFNLKSWQAACERGSVCMKVKHPTWSPACPFAAFECPFRNQESLEKRHGDSTMSGNSSHAVILGILTIQSLSRKLAPHSYWGMMTTKGRIAVLPSAVCSLCGCTMTKSPEANHWSDLSNRVEALCLGQAFQERLQIAQIFWRENNQWILDDTRP